jgi:hypothetical protein
MEQEMNSSDEFSAHAEAASPEKTWTLFAMIFWHFMNESDEAFLQKDAALFGVMLPESPSTHWEKSPAKAAPAELTIETADINRSASSNRVVLIYILIGIGCQNFSTGVSVKTSMNGASKSAT